MSKISTVKAFISLLAITVLAVPATSSTDSFVFGGCSQLKFTPGSPYESNVNLLLTSLVNSATFTTYSNFTVKSPTSQDTLYGLFQCRGDLSNGDCGRCVARAVSQLGTLCLDSSGGALQLEGCFVKYDNATFLGVEDKTEVLHKCGPLIGYDSDEMNRRDAMLDYLGTGDGSYKPFRVGGVGGVSSVAQCVQDLSANNNQNDEVEKTLAILIGLIAAVALLIVFLSFLRKACEKGKGGK
ncbi:hypothetical protein DKX38_015585 [Salix brachista]|uniref:Gnk2-homologous domain-containing protein n=1 Tax=Salix brachista TaxID=2182728 RepID=A0A5N5L5T8_9ROSI|nr:hypothetical protein DKX38_015585 [Salix brachista]